MTKLAKSTYPANHQPDSFKCFGPVATKDGEFEHTRLCDMGCFKQGEVDSNKYYVACICQSNLNQKWYAYFEWGRTGSTTNPQFQFIECGSEQYAVAEYCKQLHSKNDKRGEWVRHPKLGRILQPKANKDCYLVRPQIVRSNGLPDARNIGQAAPAIIKSVDKSDLDNEAAKLLAELNMGTIEYTRHSMVTDSIPTLDSINEARTILDEATSLTNKLKEKAWLSSKELTNLTNHLYSRIPKYKGKTAEKEEWLLTPQNIQAWRQDIDAFEAAFNAQSSNAVVSTTTLPFGLKTLNKMESVGHFVCQFFESATRNVHYNIKKITVKNVWEIKHHTQLGRFNSYITKFNGACSKVAGLLHQPHRRVDIDANEERLYSKINTAMLFHGTRTVNVAGILRECLRLPKQLSNTVITGSMFGCGIYTADDFKKSMGYTSYSGSIWSGGSGGISGRGAFIFIADVALGNPWVARSSGAYKGPPDGYHSIFGKAGYSGVQNNEYIIFDTNQLYLRYLVEIV